MFSRRVFLGSLITAPAPLQIRAGGRFYRIGIADSVVMGKPTDSQRESMTETFSINDQPKGEFEIGPAVEIVQRLNAQELSLAVLSGIEYAWHASGLPDIVPLVTAYTTGVTMKACLLVREDSDDKTLMDLQGDTISLPERLKRHNYLYLQQAIQKHGGKPEGFFGKAEIPTDSNEGIESVIDKKVDAILVDMEAWKGYQERKLPRSRKLCMIDQSVAFPTPTVLYNKSQWNKWEPFFLKIGLCSAHTKPYSRQMLNFWGVSKFVPYSKAYQKAVDEVLKAFPEPVNPVSTLVKRTMP